MCSPSSSASPPLIGPCRRAQRPSANEAVRKADTGVCDRVPEACEMAQLMSRFADRESVHRTPVRSELHAGG